MNHTKLSVRRFLPFFLSLCLLLLCCAGCSSNGKKESDTAPGTLPGGLFPGGWVPDTASAAAATSTTPAASTAAATTAPTTTAPLATTPAASTPSGASSGLQAWQQNPLALSSEEMDQALAGFDYAPYLPIPENVSRTGATLDYLYAHHGINHVGGGEKLVSITFSMGIEPGCTGRMLDILKEKEVPATFLLSLKEYLGSTLDDPEELIRRMIQEGHAIGSHGFTHIHSTMATNRRFLNELLLFQAQIDKTLRYHYPLTLFGAPYETLIERDIYLCDLMGIHFLGYSYLLSDENGQSPVYMVLPQMKQALIPGSIIQMHMSEGNTDAMAEFIDYAKEQGYRFVLPGQ
ncbi:MAG: polysaccharide deacetylase family protein [Lachnospiraceae bacterium]|nr:polysaccharide deacetylase family protein [Lachnospiraceae bacterium]